MGASGIWRALVLTGATLVATAGAAEAAVVGHRIGAPVQQGARDYWTPQRMAAAKPVPMRPVAGPVGGTAARTGPSGPPGLLPARSPRTGTGNRSSARRDDGGEVLDQREFPQSANGRLFIVQGRTRYACSASVVRSPSHSVILTAAHCSLGVRWTRQALFVPAYRRGARPFGTFTARFQAIQRPWARARNSNYDYAAMRLRANSRGRVGNVVGEQGLAWNYRRDQDYRVIGYPRNFGNGERMWSCTSSLSATDGERLGGPPSTGVDCRMKHGASGGGWTFLGGAGETPYLASVTSHAYTNRPSLLFGPYFDGRVPRLVRYVSRR